jgi:hypothetical protein
MFSKKNTRQRRKDFLIDTNLSTRKTGKKFRNRFLNILLQFRFLRGIQKMFQASVLVVVLFICMAIFIAFALFSPYFGLKKISFVRDNPLLNLEKIEDSLQDYYDKNLLFLSHDEIESLLQTEFPEIRTVEIQEIWPSEIELKITMSPPFTNIFNEETANFWVLSDDGVILESNAKEALPIIQIFQYTKPIQVSQKFLDREDLHSIFSVRDFVQQNLDLQIQEIHLYFVSREVHLITEQGTALWLDLGQDMQSQIQKLKLADEKIGLYSEAFEHIDLRIPDQVFYKKKY